MADSEHQDAKLFPMRVGERLREARKAAGLDLPDVAARTRVPQRHLEALEAGDYANLPSITYAIGFAKAHARTVGLSEVDIASALRAELDEAGGSGTRRIALEPYEPADPARVPTRILAWTAAAVALLILIGYGIWRSELLSGSDAQEAATNAVLASGQGPAPAPEPVVPETPAAPAGAVVLTATDTVWLRISDADGKRLLEREMAAGERYEVPADARDPRILTGRPEALAITIGGTAVAPLGAPEKTVKDVPISAAALNARPPVPPPAPQGQP